MKTQYLLIAAAVAVVIYFWYSKTEKTYDMPDAEPVDERLNSAVLDTAADRLRGMPSVGITNAPYASGTQFQNNQPVIVP